MNESETANGGAYDLFLTKQKETVDSFFSNKDKVIDENTKARLLKVASQGGMDFNERREEFFKQDEVLYEKISIESHAAKRKRPYFKKSNEEEN